MSSVAARLKRLHFEFEGNRLAFKSGALSLRDLARPY